MLTDEPAAEPSYFHPEARYAEREIEFLPATPVAAIEPREYRVVLADGRQVDYSRLLLATGGSARPLPVPGGDAVQTLRTVEDARRIRARLREARRVACIGAGVIGLEIASSARRLGCETEVVEAGPSVMGRCVTPDIATFIETIHREAGVVLRLGTAVTSVEGSLILCADGTVVEADFIVAGVGMRRNTALAEMAGIAVDGGIAVDPLGRSSNPDIFAAGDVAAFWHPRYRRRIRLESWRHAQDHGIAVGRAMAGAGEPYAPVPWFWTDQHGVNLQVAGLPDAASTTVRREGEAPGSFSAFHLSADGRVVAVTGVNAPRDVRAGTTLIRSGEPVDVMVLADRRVPVQRLATAARASG
jgi:3-phenylpropionate/trans-cinnamate dioxygenase ferredoxin reductase subunit